MRKFSTMEWLAGPPPQNLPDPYMGMDKQYPEPLVPLSQLNIPEGYEAVKAKILEGEEQRGRLPKDRNGILRKIGEQWWETTFIDGSILPIQAMWRGQNGTRYFKPENFDDRQTCGALLRSRDWCKAELDENRQCPYGHCGIWSARSGRACSLRRQEDFGSCRSHNNVTKKAVAAAMKDNPEKLALLPYMRPALQRIAKRMQNLPVDLHPEFITMRAQIAEMMARAKKGDSYKCWVQVQKAWNDFASPKSKEDGLAALNSLGQLIQNGLDATVAEKDVREAIVQLAQVAKVHETIIQSREKSLTVEQAVGFLQVVMGIAAEVMANNLPLLAEFRAGVQRAVSTSGNQLTFKPLKEAD